MTEETRLIYFDDSYLFESKATILEMRDREEGMKSIILDKTIFYPQGGGQPYDTGIVSGDGVEFDVQETRFEDGIVHHIGEFSNGNLNKGQPVELKINEENRRLHCKIHSGGHLVDVAMYNIDREFPSGKGFHFREGSYVEYTGFIEVDERPAAIEALNRELEKMIQTGSEITSQSVDTREEL